MSVSTDAPATPERVFYGPWANAFLKAVKATGELAEALHKAGYDPFHPADQYPAEVFVGMLALVRRHLFPDLPPGEGYRRVGRMRLTSQVQGTISGRLWAKSFPLLGPERVIQGVSKFGSSGSNFIEIRATQEGDRHWRLTFRNTARFPGEVLAGSLEYALELARTPPTRKVVVSHHDAAAEECELDVTW